MSDKKKSDHINPDEEPARPEPEQSTPAPVTHHVSRITHHPPRITNLASRFTPRSIFAAAATGAAIASVLCATGRYTEAAAAAVVMLAVGFIVSARVSVEAILIAWFVTTPIASFYAQFPRDKSLITYDRAVFALIIIILIARWWVGKTPPRSEGVIVSRFEIVWAGLSTIALVSVALNSNDLGYATKIAVDAFWLPLIAFHLARWHFDARGRGGALLLGAMALSLFLFVVGAYEFRMGENLFPYRGSEIIREGEIRANGPFASDSSYAGICSMLALFLMIAPRAMRTKLDASAKLARVCAIAAAAAAALLPQFRAIAAVLAIGSVIIYLGSRKAKKPNDRSAATPTLIGSPMPSSMGARLIAAVAIVLMISAMMLAFDGSSFGRRLTSLYNVYGRLATWKAAAEISFDRPVLGVGLANYNNYYQKKYLDAGRPVESVFNVRAASFPHSNPLWIASELGLIAFALYIMANIYMFLMGYREFINATRGETRAAAACYLALAAAYFVQGLTLTSGAYSDLNLYFFFMIGLLLNLCKRRDPAGADMADP